MGGCAAVGVEYQYQYLLFFVQRDDSLYNAVRRLAIHVVRPDALRHN